tara:strand:- start:388 stop:912 length:525 start_codon:yes stop_codon:yes gene_type:complete
MSKLARRPIDVSKVDVTFSDRILKVKGKHGELDLTIDRAVTLDISDNGITVTSKNKPYLGLYCALISNMVKGVTDQFTETLILKGVGYRATISNNVINFNLGYSHPVSYTLNDGISADLISPTEIKLTGIDKQMVGQAAARIIDLRPAKKDPYKEKGIQRSRDRIIKKVGKKVK